MKIINGKDDIFELLQSDGGRFGVSNLDDAYNFCRKVTTSHYENFPVGSILIPKKYRPYFFSVYTFSRLADDIADELDDESSETKIEALTKLSELIQSFQPSASNKNNPLLWALSDTMERKELPQEPFQKLIKAFIMDSEFVQPENMEDNINYCKYSANPVGEIVLRIFDNYNPTTAPLSDSICTGLQLVNFWQDISTDKLKNRLYIPKETLRKFGLDEKMLFGDAPKVNLDACLKDIYDFTEKFFIFGVELIKYLENKRLKLEIALTVEGGKMILDKVKKTGVGIVRTRPKLGKTDILKIFINLVFRKSKV